MNITIDKFTALRILRDHGFTPDALTAVDVRTGEMVPNTSFYAHFGERETYIRADVMFWLGY